MAFDPAPDLVSELLKRQNGICYSDLLSLRIKISFVDLILKRTPEIYSYLFGFQLQKYYFCFYNVLS